MIWYVYKDVRRMSPLRKGLLIGLPLLFSIFGAIGFYLYEISVALFYWNDDWNILLLWVILIGSLSFFGISAILLFKGELELEREKRDWKLFGISLVACLTIFSLTLVIFSIFISPIQVENHFFDNVKGGIFFYENETNPEFEDITMIVINTCGDLYFDEVYFKLDFLNENYSLSVRMNNTDLKSGYNGSYFYPPVKGSANNFTEISWNKTNGFETPLVKADGAYSKSSFIYANFTIKSNSANKNLNTDFINLVKDPIIRIKRHPDFKKDFDISEIKRLEGSPNITILDDGKWDVSNVFNQIRNAKIIKEENEMNLLNIGTLLVAFWGAILSTILLVYKFFYEDRRQVNVKLEEGNVIQRGCITIHTLIVSFYNCRRRPITITSYGIWLPDGTHMPLYRLVKNIHLPQSFSDGQGDMFIGYQNRIVSTIRNRGLEGKIKIKGYVQDISGEKHFSREICITI